MKPVAEFVAEAALSFGLGVLLEKLSSSLSFLRFAHQKSRDTELEKWETKLKEIREVLNDAEKKQIDNDSVKEWLRKLRDLAYDMEDVLDEFSYEDLRISLEGGSSKVSHKLMMGSRMNELNTRLEDIYDKKAELGLDKAGAIAQSTWERPPTTSSLVHEPWVFGRDADKQKIMDMLLKDNEPNQTDSFSVVSIVAMGGTGKTTLARLVYDDDEIRSHFNLKAWACVSDPFNAMRVTKTILNEFTSGSSNDSNDLNQIQTELREELKGKRFLLVLDDVWTEDYGDWLSLQPLSFQELREAKS